MALNRQSIFLQDDVSTTAAIMPTDLLSSLYGHFQSCFYSLIILSEWFLALEALAPR